MQKSLVKFRGDRIRFGVEVADGRVFFGRRPGQAPATLPEHLLRDELAFQLDGITEAALPYGRADVLTSTTAFEVEPLRSWKTGARQALAYAVQTGCEPGLAIFGTASPPEVLRLYLKLRDERPPIQFWSWNGCKWVHITSRAACRAMHPFDINPLDIGADSPDR